MNKRIVLLIIILFHTIGTNFKLYANTPPGIGAQAIAQGGCGMLNNNSFSANTNVANLAWNKKTNFGIAVQNYYGIKKLNQLNCALAIPLKQSAYGVQLQYFGNGTFTQITYGVAMAYKLMPTLSFGLAANIHNINITNYGNKSALSIDAGVQAKISDKLNMAFGINSANRAKLNQWQDERLEHTVRLGMLYQASDKVFILSEVEKNNLLKPNLKFGINYQYSSPIQFQMGASLLNPQFSFGMGYCINKNQFNYAANIHPLLGVNHTFSYIFTY